MILSGLANGSSAPLSAKTLSVGAVSAKRSSYLLIDRGSLQRNYECVLAICIILLGRELIDVPVGGPDPHCPSTAEPRDSTSPFTATHVRTLVIRSLTASVANEDLVERDGEMVTLAVRCSSSTGPSCYYRVLQSPKRRESVVRVDRFFPPVGSSYRPFW